MDQNALLKIVKEEGVVELYRGLTPSLIGVIPYSATNYFAYDTLRKAYRKVFKKEKIGNIETILIGSTTGAIPSCATFPLEVSCKHMQVGALSGSQVYKNVIHALVSILEQEGIQGL
ncbi:Adenine nucleotide transporter BT1, chloroplastic/mitochondrial, partial [Mucuna pruriens]